MHQLINGLVRRLDDVYQPFMGLNDEILTAVSVDERAPSHIDVFLVRRQGNWTGYPCTCPHGNVKYFLTAVINNPAVVRF